MKIKMLTMLALVISSFCTFADSKNENIGLVICEDNRGNTIQLKATATEYIILTKTNSSEKLQTKATSTEYIILLLKDMTCSFIKA